MQPNESYKQIEDEIRAGMLQWEPNTLSTHTLERILTDALADIWADCYRRDVSEQQRVNLFREKLMEAIRCATGQRMRVT